MPRGTAEREKLTDADEVATLHDELLATDKAQRVYFADEPRGFGLVVGRTSATWIINKREGGKVRRETIGRAQLVKGDGGLTPREARKEARIRLGKRENNEPTPGTKRRASKLGPTLKESLKLYVEHLAAVNKRPSAIELVDREIPKYLDALLKRPLASITVKEVRARHEKLSESSKHSANRVFEQFRAVWNYIAKKAVLGLIDGWEEGHEFPKNPTKYIEWNTEKNTPGYRKRRQEPIEWPELPAWYDAVQTLGGIRRDYRMLALLTGIRRNDLATVRWQHVNTTDAPITVAVWRHKEVAKGSWENEKLPSRSMLRPVPKGGHSRSFSVPLSSACIEILERRRAENATQFPTGDGGWVFPTHAKKNDSAKKRPCYLCKDLGMPEHVAGNVIHLDDPRDDDETVTAHSTHSLRETYTTALAALEPIVSPYVIEVLTNHRQPKGSVTAQYIKPSPEQLAATQERVAEFLLSKCGGTPKQRRAEMYAV